MGFNRLGGSGLIVPDHMTPGNPLGANKDVPGGGGGLSAYATKVMGYSPDIYFPLNEAAGASECADAMGNSTPAQLVGAGGLTFGEAGPEAGGLSALFDAAGNAYIDWKTAWVIANVTDTTDYFTMMIWTKKADAAASWRRCLQAQYQSGGAKTWWQGYYNGVNEGGFVEGTSKTTNTLGFGNWGCHMIRRDPLVAGGTLYWYLNSNVAFGSQAFKGGGAGATWDYCQIGATSVPGDFFNGNVAHFALWINRDWAAGEITDIMTV